MYLIRGIGNIETFNKKFPNQFMSGTIGNFDGLHLGHLGLAIASSISAIVSVIILSFILKRDGLISFSGILSAFSLKVLIASVALISFLSIFNLYFDFELFSQGQRLLHLVAGVIGSLIIYFGSSFILGVRPADFK